MSAADADAEQGGQPSAAGRRRSVARLGAVQALYQLALNPGLAAETVVGEFRRHRLGREIDGEVYGEADEKLFSDIVRRVAAPGVRRDTLRRAQREMAAAPAEDDPAADPRSRRLRIVLSPRHPAAGDA